MIIECHPAQRIPAPPGFRVWHPRNSADPDVSAVVVHALTGWVGDRPAFGNWHVIRDPAVVCGPGEIPTVAERAALVRRRKTGGAARRSACGGRVEVVRAAS
jgi:hypothetical protein